MAVDPVAELIARFRERSLVWTHAIPARQVERGLVGVHCFERADAEGLVLAWEGGRVACGLVSDEIAVGAESVQLAGFRTGWDEIIGLHTARRPLGGGWELLVVVRPLGGEPRLYRAVIEDHGVRLLVRPDGVGAVGGDGWQSLAAGAIAWHHRVPYTPGRADRAESPPWPRSIAGDAVGPTTWTGLYWATGDELGTVTFSRQERPRPVVTTEPQGSDGPQTQRVELGYTVRGIVAAGMSNVVVATAEPSLVTLVEKEGAWRIEHRHRLRFDPAGIAVRRRTCFGSTFPPIQWPGLILASRDGWVSALRFLGQTAECEWSIAGRSASADDLDRAVAAGALGSAAAGAARILCLLENTADPAPIAAALGRSDYAPGVARIGNFLAEKLRDARLNGPKKDTDRLVTVAWAIYAASTSFELRYPIDEEMAHWEVDSSASADLRALASRSGQGAWSSGVKRRDPCLVAEQFLTNLYTLADRKARAVQPPAILDAGAATLVMDQPPGRFLCRIPLVEDQIGEMQPGFALDPMGPVRLLLGFPVGGETRHVLSGRAGLRIAGQPAALLAAAGDDPCVAAAWRGTSAEAGVLLLVLRGGRASRLGLFEIEGASPTLAVRRSAVIDLDIPAVTCVAVEQAAAALRLYLGSNDDPTLRTWSVDIGTLTACSDAQRRLDSGVTAVHVASAEELVIVGTVEGIVWALRLPDLAVRWTFRPRYEVVSLDLQGAEGGWHLIVAARRDCLVILDQDGRRLWRRRVRGTIAGAGFVRGAARPSILAWTTEGALELYGLSDDAPPVPHGRTPPDVVGAIAAARRGEWERRADRQAQRVLLERAAAKTELEPTNWAALALRASYRELATMARALVHPAPAGRLDALRAALTVRRSKGEHGDDSTRARDAAWAELFRAMAREGVRTDYLREVAEDVPADALLDRWPSLELARVWVAALAADGSLEFAPALSRIDALPPRAAAALPLLLPQACQPDFLAALAALATGGGGVAEALPRIVAVRLAGHSSPVGPLAAWRAAADLLAARGAAAWTAALTLVREGRASAEPTQSPLAAAVRALGPCVGADIPEDAWPLDQQISWIRAALSRTLDLGDPADTEQPWSRLGRRIAAALAQAFREAALARLTTLVGLTRPRVVVTRREWMAPNLLDLDLRLEPEGQRTVHKAATFVRAVGLSAAGKALAPHRVEWAELDSTRGAVPVRLHGVCAPGLAELVIEVHTTAADQEPYTYTATVELPDRQPAVEVRSPFPFLVDLLAPRLLAIKGGVHLVAVDAGLDPEALRRALGRGGGSAQVDVDVGAHPLGPGRDFPDDLTLPALVALLNGDDPHKATTGQPLRRAAERLVLHGLSDTIARLSDPPLARLREEVVEFLRDHAARGAQPALILLAPAAECAVLRRLAGDVVGWVHPARLSADSDVEAATLGVLARHLEAARPRRGGEPGDTPEGLLRAAWGDLRVLADALRRDPPRVSREVVLAAARDDLRALEPNTLLALVYLSGARVALPTSRLAVGMVPDETLELTMARHVVTPTRLATRGERLRRVPTPDELGPRHPRVWVRGWAEDIGNAALPGRSGLRRVVHDIAAEIDRLVALGFARRDGPVTRISGLYADAVAECTQDGLHEGIRRLAGLDVVWEVLALADLAELDHATQQILLGPVPVERARLRQHLGEAWRDSDLPDQELLVDLSVLTGAPVSLASEQDVPIHQMFPRARLFDVAPGTRGAAAVVAWLPSGTTRAASSVTGPLGGPLTVLLGPGVESLARTVPVAVVLGDGDVRRSLRPGATPAVFWAIVRGKGRVEMVSPFRSSGALPPGSPIFVGREDVLSPVLRDIRTTHFLILGPRQVGKTSLLNRLLFELRQEDDLATLYVDAQGVRSGSALRARMPTGLPDDPVAAIKVLTEQCTMDGKQLVVLINEIDGLLEGDPGVIAGLRGQGESSPVRFVLVGYANAEAGLHSLMSPLYHFTRGTVGARGFVLSSLGEPAALELIDRLTVPPLAFAWASSSDEEQGRALLLRRSYRIPWLLQHLCDALCRRLIERRDGLLYRSDVEAVLEQGNPLGKYIAELELGEVAGHRGSPLHATTARLLLTAQAWELYFGADRRVEQAHLDRRDPARWSFTASDVLASAHRVLDVLPVSPAERAALSAFLHHFHTGRLLDGMCLTILLRRITGAVELRYCFEGHIYPLELRRQEAEPGGRSVIEVCLELVLGLLPLIHTKERQ